MLALSFPLRARSVCHRCAARPTSPRLCHEVRLALVDAARRPAERSRPLGNGRRGGGVRDRIRRRRRRRGSRRSSRPRVPPPHFFPQSSKLRGRHVADAPDGDFGVCCRRRRRRHRCRGRCSGLVAAAASGGELPDTTSADRAANAEASLLVEGSSALSRLFEQWPRPYARGPLVPVALRATFAVPAAAATQRPRQQPFGVGKIVSVAATRVGSSGPVLPFPRYPRCP